MLARALIKCLNVLVILFLMCPNRSHLSVPIGNQQEYYHAVRRSSNMKFSENILPALRYHSEKIVDKDNFEEAEPGLYLTDEQARKFKLWDKGMVPYYIDVLSFADKVLRDRIRWFLNLVNSLTSLNFVELPRPPKDDQMRWVFFVNRRGRLSCADHSTINFTNKGVQPVALGYDCMNTGGELAEAVLAIAGVPPQHNSPDRDDYIEILNDNIMPDKLYLFEKLDDDEWLFRDVSYDFASAGHFHNHKYSANGQATIKTKGQSEGIPTGKPGGLSNKDIWKIKMLYNYIIKTKEKKNTELQCRNLFVHRGMKNKSVKKRKSKGKGSGLKSTRPKSTRPKTTRPQTTRPQTTRPQTTRPQTTRPQTTRPQTTRTTTTRTTTTRTKTTHTKTSGSTKRPPKNSNLNITVNIDVSIEYKPTLEIPSPKDDGDNDSSKNYSFSSEKETSDSFSEDKESEEKESDVRNSLRT